MIKNKLLSIVLAIINIIYLIVLTVIKDPFVYNYSMFTSNIKGYLMVFILCILLSINLANTTYLLNKKYTILALIGPIIGCIFPYFKDTGNLLSNIHETCAYISFGIVMFINLSNINRYKVYNYKRGILIERLFIIIFILDGLIYLKLLGVTSIQETILLSTILIIQEYLYSQILKK